GVGRGDLGPKRRNWALIDEAKAVNKSAQRSVRSAFGIIISRHCSCLRVEANPLTTVIHGDRQEHSGRGASRPLWPRARTLQARLNRNSRASLPAPEANPIPVPGNALCAKRLLL